MTEKQFIQNDRMKYKKNAMSANFTYLAIAFNVIYFILIYHFNSNYFYKTILGASVVYNLIFLLIAFLCSEGVKNYKMSHAIILIALAIGQLIRIFIFPQDAYSAQVDGEYLISEGQYIRMLIYLIASAAFALAAGITGILRTVKLNKHFKFIKENEGESFMDLTTDTVADN